MRRSVVLAAVAAFALSCPALAKSSHAVTVLAPPRSVGEWAKGISTSLDRDLKYPRNIREVAGAVSVGFSCSDTGETKEISVLRSSGSRALDIAATRAVSRIRNMHPMPEGTATGQRFQADLFFAQSSEGLRAQQARLERDLRRSPQHFASATQKPVRISVLASR